MPGRVCDPEPGDIIFPPLCWKSVYHWTGNAQKTVWSQSCLRVSEAVGAFCSSRVLMLTRLPFAPHAQTWEPPCVRVLPLGHTAPENHGVVS